MGHADGVADFSDVEEMVLQGRAPDPVLDQSQLASMRDEFAGRLQEVERLEQLASACTSRELSDQVRLPLTIPFFVHSRSKVIWAVGT
jgi:hypothetical protein